MSMTMITKLLYNGSSMNPLFQEGDVVQVAPCDGLELLPGDVVAFVPPEQTGKVIHRVVAVHPRGIITKGDNVAAADDWLLAPRDILGKVVSIHRQGRLIPVPRQPPVSLYLLRVRRWCSLTLSPLLQPVYRRLVDAGLFQGRLAAWLKPRLLYFPHADGPEWQLWLGTFLIGRKPPRLPCWTIRRPFRLFVDEAGLPHEPPGSATSR